MESVLDVTDGHFLPATVAAAERPLSTLSFVAAMIRNPISAWPKQVCEEWLFIQKVGSQVIAFVSDPDLLKVIFAPEEARFAKNPIERRVFGPLLGEGILTSENENWRWQRRAAAPLFRPADLLAHVPEITSAALRVLARWDQSGSRWQSIDRAMKRATFEVVVGALLADDDDVDMEAIERWTDTYLAGSSWEMVYALLKLPAWFPHPHKRGASRAARNIRAKLGALAANRNREHAASKDLLGRLLVAPDPQSGCPMASQQVLDNVTTFLIAGHETTYSTLTWCLYLLARYPDWQRRVAAEVARVANGLPISAEHVGGLQTCEQVINEALRLYPPAPILSRVSREDVVLAGQKFAAGTMFFIPVYAVHRHRRLWRNPDSFDPSRFDAGQAAPSRWCFMPFGLGPRTCIGASFAMLEAKVILATLVQRAWFSPTLDAEPVPLARITLRPRRALRLHVALNGHCSSHPLTPWRG